MHIARRDRLIAIALVSLFLAVVTPIGVYRTNFDELNFGLLEFLPTSLILLILGAGMLVAVECLGRVLLGEIRTYVALSCLFYLLWLQANVLKWPYGVLEDGDWYHKWHFGAIDGAIWIIVVSLGVRFAGLLSPLFLRVNVWALVVLVLSVPFSVFGLPLHRSAYVLDEAPLFDFSPERNVIVILLDQAQSDVFLELASEAEFANAFTGFTFFADYMANAQNTSLSVPMSLTGRYYDNSEKYANFVRDGMLDASLPRLLKDAGFRSDLFFRYNIFADEWLDPRFVSNLETREGYRFAPAAQVTELGLFVSLPHFAKRLIYDGEDWLFQHTMRDAGRRAKRTINRRPRKAPSQAEQLTEPGPPVLSASGDRDTQFVKKLLKAANLSSTQPTFKFYHWVGAHPPLRIDENGDPLPRETWGTVGTYHRKLRYKMRLLVEVLEHLKTLNVYDRSLIVVISDHGNGLRDDTRAIRDPHTGTVRFHDYETARANALLMLKDFDAEYPLKVLPHPLESLDIKDLIFRRVQGETLDTILDEIPTDRVRRFVNYFVNEFRPYAKRFRELLVVGPVWNPDSFLFLHTHRPAYPPGHCPAAEGRLRYRHDLVATDWLQVTDDNLQLAPPPGVGPNDRWLALIQLERAGDNAESVSAEASLPSAVQIETSRDVSYTFHLASGSIELLGRGPGQVQLSIDSPLRIRGLHFFEVSNGVSLQ